MQFCSNGTFNYGFVQFKAVNSAVNALRQSKHYIGKQVVNVKQAHNWHQPDYNVDIVSTMVNDAEIDVQTDPLSKPLDQSSEMHILNAINDDCLKEVFKYLPLQDLCNAAEVCVRFKQNANEHFKACYTDLDTFDLKKVVEKNDIWDIDDDGCASDVTTTEFWFDLKFVEQLLRNFGKFIKSFTAFALFQDENENRKSLSLLNQYCAGTLQELRLFGFEIKGRTITTLRPLFAALEKLTMYSCTTEEKLHKLLSVCNELKVLKFGHCNRFIEKSLLVKFPKLIELELSSINDHVDDNFLDELLLLNGTIEKLSIIHTDLPSIVFKHIARRLPKVHTLFFNQNFEESGDFEKVIQENLLHLGKMESLKSLSINCNGFALNPLVDRFANAKISLEHLTILHGSVDLELVKGLAALNSLSKLELINAKMAKVSLTDVAKHLPQLIELGVRDITGASIADVKKMLPFAKRLQALTLTSTTTTTIANMHIDNESYERILQTVKNRDSHTKLVISIASHHKNVAVPTKVMQLNRNWLELKEERIPKLDLKCDDDGNESDNDDDDDEEEDNDDDGDEDGVWEIDSDSDGEESDKDDETENEESDDEHEYVQHIINALINFATS